MGKLIFPDLNINYDGSPMLFVDLALVLDYALFYWARFAKERSNPGTTLDQAITNTMRTSGFVIVVSNFFVGMAWLCTLTFPGLNNWGLLGFYLEASFGAAIAGSFFLLTA